MTLIDNIPLIDAITQHIQRQGGGYSKWYVGITDDRQRRLHTEHNVPLKGAWYILRTAMDKNAAEMIEKYFLDQGCQGAQGGGNEKSKIVYAYLITSNTNE